ncbi:hypothetical protein M0R01_03715 [bacterium]|nr:hypothetical protein [bacterium]
MSNSDFTIRRSLDGNDLIISYFEILKNRERIKKSKAIPLKDILKIEPILIKEHIIFYKSCPVPDIYGNYPCALVCGSMKIIGKDGSTLFDIILTRPEDFDDFLKRDNSLLYSEQEYFIRSIKALNYDLGLTNS